MRAADNGWGAWADIDVLETAPLAGVPMQTLASGRMTVFVPPPLVDSIHAEMIFEGEITYRGGPRGGVYAIRNYRS